MRKVIVPVVTVLFIVFMISVPILAVKPETKPVNGHQGTDVQGDPPGSGGVDRSSGPPTSPGKSDTPNGGSNQHPGDGGPIDDPGNIRGRTNHP